ADPHRRFERSSRLPKRPGGPNLSLHSAAFGPARRGRRWGMADLITPDDLPRWVPGELTLDTHAMDWEGVRPRGYRYDSSDVPVPAMQDYMIVAYQHGHTPMQRRCEGPWRSDRMVPGDISVLTHAAESHWTWSEPIEVIHLYLSPAKVAEVASS